MPLLYALSTAFTLWMLYDAMQRRAPCHWFWVICVPMGEFAYFFAVKIHDFDLSPRAGQRAPSADALRYRVEHNPCAENQVELARALYDRGEFAEAAGLCEAALRRDDDFKHAHYGLGRCRLRMGDPEGAEASLRRVVELDRAYEDWSAWLDWVEALRLQGRREEAVAQLEALVAASPRIVHSVALARALHEAGRSAEAGERLAAALRDWEHAPRHVRKLGRPHLREARQLLGQLA